MAAGVLRVTYERGGLGRYGMIVDSVDAVEGRHSEDFVGEADGVEAGVTYVRVICSTTVVVVVVVTSVIRVPGGYAAWMVKLAFQLPVI